MARTDMSGTTATYVVSEEEIEEKARHCGNL